jgi:hypothetical protein
VTYRTRFTAPLALMGVAALVCLTSCTPQDRPSWRDQLIADSPCYRVDLSNGLLEETTAEVEDLFACLDYHGHLESLRPTMAALRPTNVGGAPGLIDIARAVNALPDAGVDIGSSLGVAIDLLRDPAEPLQGVLDLSLELATGQPARTVRSGAVDPTQPSVLRGGVLAPLASVVPDLAESLLDAPSKSQAIGEGLRSDTMHRWIYSTASYSRSAHPDVRALIESVPQDAGDAVLATRDGVDGLWAGGTDDSLRDLVDVMVGTDTRGSAMTELAQPLGVLLADDGVRSRTGALLRTLHADGTLDSVVTDLGWLASTNVDGLPAQRGELSGLESLVRLLDAANQPMVCTLDLGFTDISVNLGNLSVSLLGLVNDLEPSTVQSGAGILGAIVDANLSQSLLGNLANSGLCPALTPTLVQDLQVLDLLFDDNASALVAAFLGVTKALEDEGHLEDFVELTSILWDTDAVWALGDVIRDTAYEPVWEHVLGAIPMLLDPPSFGLPADTIAFDDAWDALNVLVADPELGWPSTADILRPIANADGVWVAVGNLAELLADGRSEAAHSLELVADWVSADPDLALLDSFAVLLAEPDISEPVLRMAATQQVSAALLASTPVASQDAVPLAFWCRLVTTGAVDDVLSLAERVINGIDPGEPDE